MINYFHQYKPLHNLPALMPKAVKEFFQAATQPFSFNLKKNLYIWFGILWGIPIPVVTILIQMKSLEATGLSGSFLHTLSSASQWFFLAHPLLFGYVFGILGTIRNDKDIQLKAIIEQLREQSTLDPLTKLKNRRFFAHNFHDECARSLRRKEPLSLLFLDIDNFKHINDVYGHHTGDIVLKKIADFIAKKCRPYDTPVRWGGEEFIILLRATDEQAAFVFAERIRTAVESGISSSLPFTFTVSIGLTEHQSNDTLEQITDRADQALYHAKKTGKNKVVVWTSLPLT